MMNPTAAAFAGMALRPSFEVHPIDPDEEFERHTVTVQKDKSGKYLGLQHKTVIDKGGFMVYFPAGHSIRVRDHAELVRLGFDHAPEVVDMNSGERVPMPDTSLKSHVERVTKPPRRNQMEDAA